MRIVSPFTEERRALHFRQLDRYPHRPHSFPETTGLLQAVEQGGRAAAELAGGRVTGSRSRELRHSVERGERAKNSLAVAHLCDAHWYARCLAQTRRGRGAEVEDLMQEALIGLLRAIETFGPQTGCGFENYAGHRMQRAVRRALDEHARRRRGYLDDNP